MLFGLPEELWLLILDFTYKSDNNDSDNLLYMLLLLGNRGKIDIHSLVKSYFYRILCRSDTFKTTLSLYNKVNTKNICINTYQYMGFYSVIFKEQINNRYSYINNLKYINFMYNSLQKNNILGRSIFYNILLNKYLNMNKEFLTISKDEKVLNISDREKIIIKLLL